MSNHAAILPGPKATVEIRTVEKYAPGPKEVLIKNEIIAFNPVEYKLAKLNILPLPFPTILGSTSAGTVEEIGSQVTDFQIGDRVVAYRKFGVPGDQYAAYQRYVVGAEGLVSKIPENIDPAVPASVMMNASCVVGLFTGRLGLDRPHIDAGTVAAAAQSKDCKVLIYGGSSSFGGLAIQYLSQAGYTVITTSSPKNQDFVSPLGAAAIIDHTFAPDDVVDKLIHEGPYQVVVDMISVPSTIDITSRVLAAQGGGNLYTMQPAFGPEKLPDGVTRVFEPWTAPLYEEKNAGLLAWVMRTYIPQGLVSGAITPVPVEKVAGGLKAVDQVLDRLMKGVSGVRLVVEPWEGGVI